MALFGNFLFPWIPSVVPAPLFQSFLRFYENKVACYKAVSASVYLKFKTHPNSFGTLYPVKRALLDCRKAVSPLASA
jgi:hypothetical protein